MLKFGDDQLDALATIKSKEELIGEIIIAITCTKSTSNLLKAKKF
jgi:hypothetical protein